eukprot:gene19459-26121_t
MVKIAVTVVLVVPRSRNLDPQDEQKLKELVAKHRAKFMKLKLKVTKHGTKVVKIVAEFGGKYDRFKLLNTGSRDIGKWMHEEGVRLQQSVRRLGKKWKNVAAQVGTRTSSQCRERYNNCLDPDLNLGAFTEEEATLLRARYDELKKAHGRVSWGRVADVLRGRTDSMCKRAWHQLVEMGRDPSQLRGGRGQNHPKLREMRHVIVSSDTRLLLPETADADAIDDDGVASDKPGVGSGAGPAAGAGVGSKRRRKAGSGWEATAPAGKKSSKKKKSSEEEAPESGSGLVATASAGKKPSKKKKGPEVEAPEAGSTLEATAPAAKKPSNKKKGSEVEAPEAGSILEATAPAAKKPSKKKKGPEEKAPAAGSTLEATAPAAKTLSKKKKGSEVEAPEAGSTLEATVSAAKKPREKKQRAEEEQPKAGSGLVATAPAAKKPRKTKQSVEEEPPALATMELSGPRPASNQKASEALGKGRKTAVQGPGPASNQKAPKAVGKGRKTSTKPKGSKAVASGAGAATGAVEVGGGTAGVVAVGVKVGGAVAGTGEAGVLTTRVVEVEVIPAGPVDARGDTGAAAAVVVDATRFVNNGSNASNASPAGPMKGRKKPPTIDSCKLPKLSKHSKLNLNLNAKTSQHSHTEGCAPAPDSHNQQGECVCQNGSVAGSEEGAVNRQPHSHNTRSGRARKIPAYLRSYQ